MEDGYTTNASSTTANVVIRQLQYDRPARDQDDDDPGGTGVPARPHPAGPAPLVGAAAVPIPV